MMEEKELMRLIGNGTGLEQIIIEGIKKDIGSMEKDGSYFFYVMGEIVYYAQDFECCLKKFLSMNNINESNIWKTRALVAEFKKKKLFSSKEVEILEKIIELRNWAVHKIFEQEKQGSLTFDYRNCKLAVAKHMIFEAIDFVNDKIDKTQGRSGVANVVNNSYNN